MSAPAGRAAPNQVTYVRASIQKQSPHTGAIAICAPATPTRPSPAYTAPAVSAPPTTLSAACSSMRLYPRFIPWRADSGSVARPMSSVAPSVSAVARRSVPYSGGPTPVIAGASHTISAAAATARGRKISQTTSAAPKARR